MAPFGHSRGNTPRIDRRIFCAKKGQQNRVILLPCRLNEADPMLRAAEDDLEGGGCALLNAFAISSALMKISNCGLRYRW
jgi:hypothetical protein